MQAQIVDTEAEIVLRKGSHGLLPCRVDKEVAGVYWSKGPTFRTSTLLLLMEFHDNTWKREIPEDSKQFYNINDNFSLVINRTRIQDNGLFFCEILDLDTGTPFVNQTSVTVFGKFYCLFCRGMGSSK